MKNLKIEKGITLIALVITIIVLMILAGVSIAMLLGESGIITQALEAAEITKRAAAEEKVKLAVMSSYTALGELDESYIKGELEKQADSSEEISVQIPGQIKFDGYTFDITEDGEVTTGNDESINQDEWDKIATPESAFIWGSDVPGEEGYNNIVGYNAELANYTKVRIPSRAHSIEGTYGGTESSVGRAYLNQIKEIELSPTLTSIGTYAFGGIHGNALKEVESIVIPEGVKTIGYYSFNGCYKLANITFPSTIESVESSSFYGTSWLNNLPDGELYIGNILYKYIGQAPANTTINIKEGTKEICEMAFYSQDNIINVIIPDSVTTIGDNAFYYCENLVNITIPDSVKTIGSSSFDRTAWYDNQPDGIIYINSVLYEYKGDMPSNTSIVIREGTESICGYSFYGRTELTDIIIPDTVKSIGNHAFYDCNSLSSVIIPQSVTTMGYGVFYGCDNLININCRVQTKPSGWNDNWDEKSWQNKHNVVWGYSG